MTTVKSFTPETAARLHVSDVAPTKNASHFRLEEQGWTTLGKAMREYGSLKFKGLVVDVEVMLEDGDTHFLDGNEIQSIIDQNR